MAANVAGVALVPDAWRRARNLAFVACAGLFAAYAAFFGYHGVVTLLHPFPLNYGEGAVLNAARLIASHEHIYRAFDQLPAVSANYPPFFLVLHAIGDIPFGPGFAWGRGISLVAALVAATAIGTAEPWKAPRARWIGMGLWLSLGPVYAWSAIDKADMLAIALSLWGATLVRRNHWMFAGLLLGLAALTKQTALTALLAVAIVGAVGTHREGSARSLLPVATAMVVILVGSSLAMLGLGGAYLDHVVFGNLQEMSLRQAVIAALILLRDHWPLLLLACTGVVVAVRHRTTNLWHCYGPLALLAFLLTAGKTGAYTNYYLEVLALSCVLAASSIDRSASRPGPSGAILLALVLLQGLLVVHVPHVREYADSPSRALRSEQETVLGIVRQIGPPLLAENAAWNVLLGTEALVDDPFFFAQLAAAGKWDSGLLRTPIQEGYFRVILLEFDPMEGATNQFHLDRFPPDVLRAMRERYRATRQGEYWILTPR